MRYFYWAFVLLMAIIVAAFFVSNRDLVTLALWPLPYSLTTPLYLALIVTLAIGLIVGRLFGYSGGSPVRRERNRLRIKTRELEAELARLKRSTGATVSTDIQRIA